MFDSQYYQVAKQAALRGGRVLMEYFGNDYHVHNKSAYNLVSDADLKSERAILDTIRSTFPGHSILAEEEANSLDPTTEHLWIVDPLDGTNNFVHGINHFAVSIGYYHQGRSELGIVFNPAIDEWFIAQRGQGAFHNDSPVCVSKDQKLNQVLVGVGFYYDRGSRMVATLRAMQELFGRDIHGVRRMGTASLDLCMVGCGNFGAYFEFELSPWDFAAGVLFVEEAGGCVSSCFGEKLAIANTSILATNQLLHKDMIEIIQPYYQEALANQS